MTRSRVQRWSSVAIESLAIALVYFLLARVGQLLAIEPGNVTPIWPASGFALVVVLYRGYRTWPGLWLGNFLGNTWAFLDTSTFADAMRTVATGIAIGPGDVLQALIGAYLIRCFCQPSDLFARIRNVFLFVGSQSIACLSSATLGVLALCTGSVIPWQAFGYTWLTWFLGDGIGVILIAPWIMTLPQARSLLASARMTGEGLMILALTVLASHLVFAGVIDESLIFLPVAFVLWAAIRANQFAVSSTVLAVWSVAFACSVRDSGPFSIGKTNDALMLMQLYTAIAMITGSVVRAAITELNAKEESLRWSEEKFRRVVEASPAGILILDETGTQRLANTEVLRLFGYSREELLEKPVESLFDGSCHGKLSGLQKAAVTNRNAPSGGELTALRKDGSEFDVEIAMRFLHTESGPRLLCSLVDITSRQETIRALRLAKKSAEDASRAKTGFLANISHEIRTPMNAVIGMSQLMLDTELTPAQRDRLSTINESADTLMAIINEVLDFSRIEAGQVHIESRPFSLRQLLDNTLGPLLAQAQSKDLKLVSHIEDDVPDGVCGDAGRLRHVITNLVGNAIKFTHDGEIVLGVAASPQVQREIELRVSVRDTGIGIANDQQQAVFDAFTQADMSTTRPFGGTGLGLSVAKTLVELMGGELSLESNVGVGSTFTFTTLMLLATEGELVAGSNAGAQDLLRPLNVLLAEDGVTNQKVIAGMLNKLGHEVIVVENGREAVEHLGNSTSIDVVLMDVSMPIMDGLEATREIRRLEQGTDRRVPIIAATAHAMTGDRERCLAAGMDHYLSKPIRMSALKQLLVALFADDNRVNA